MLLSCGINHYLHSSHHQPSNPLNILEAFLKCYTPKDTAKEKKFTSNYIFVIAFPTFRVSSLFRDIGKMSDRGYITAQIPETGVKGGVMSQEEKPDKKKTVENFGEMFKAFGEAISEIFNDPRLKEKAKEFAESAAESAKILGQKFKDEEVKNKFRDVGKAAQDFGKGVADTFKADKDKEK